MENTLLKKLIVFTGMFLCVFITSCKDDVSSLSVRGDSSPITRSAYSSTLPFLKGADLSYVNELEDVGVVYTENGVEKDAYQLLNNYGANAIRLRLWHNPTWTNYSNLNDVKKSIGRAKALNMYVLLDFHYSDTWTDPEQNLVPAAWLSVVDDTSTLADSVYNYTTKILTELKNSNLLPDMVQIGNETNKNIMVSDNSLLLPIDYSRNVTLFNAGLNAVKQFNETYSKNIKTVLHVAMDPGNAMTWVNALKDYDIMGFDMLGLSYYPQWQGYTPKELGEFTASLLHTHKIQLLVAETGHIWTRTWNDESHNLMSKMAPGYPEAPCPQLQKDFLIEVKNAVRNNGGAGVLAWEPTWVSADNVTLWGVGSNWENVAFFDFDNELLTHGGIEFYSESNVAVTFKVDMTGVNVEHAYITGEFTKGDYDSWQIFPMKREGTTNIYQFTTYLSQGQSGAYYYLSDSTWTARETVPSECQAIYSDRAYYIGTNINQQIISNVWSSCDSEISSSSNVAVTFRVDMTNSGTNEAYITGDFTADSYGTWQIVPMQQVGNTKIYQYTVNLPYGKTGAYFYLNGDAWTDREIVPAECQESDADRVYTISSTEPSQIITNIWASCGTIE